MPEFRAPPHELVQHLNSNRPWAEIAEELGYDNGREARLAATKASRQLDAETVTA